MPKHKGTGSAGSKSGCPRQLEQSLRLLQQVAPVVGERLGPQAQLGHKPEHATTCLLHVYSLFSAHICASGPSQRARHAILKTERYALCEKNSRNMKVW